MKRFKSTILVVLPFFFAVQVSAQEVCDNGVDDDADGLIDLNDPDCDCESLIDLSVLPNPSFEDRSCCPSDEAQLDCADFWNQASDATSDYYNLCDFSEFGFDGALPAELPLPGGGEGFVGVYSFLTGYREYIGSCTIGPLLAGVSYTLNFQTAYSYGDDDEFEFNLFGSPDCGDLPWDGVSCPEGEGGWMLLVAEEITYEMDGSWQEVSVSFTPLVNIAAVAFGGPCGDLGDTDGAYFYFDDLVLVDSEVTGYVDAPNGWCSDDPTIYAITEDLGGTWQWYKEGIALLGETMDQLNPVPYGEGTFTARYSYVDGCKTMSYTSPFLPTANFSHEDVCIGNAVEFVNLSDGDLDLDDPYLWIFGDGDTENAENASHFYAAPDVYVAELVAYSEDVSCHDTVSTLVTVSAKPDVAFELSGASVTWTGSEWMACANSPITFTDESTIDGEISFMSWNWSFGNGETSTDQNAESIYTDEGDYLVKLIIEAENGCVDSTSEQLSVSRITADFTVTDSLCQGLETIFSEDAYLSAGTTIDSLRWILGEPVDTITDPSTTFLYEEAGLYEANLLVISNLGCVDSVTKPVLVHPNPDVDFYADKSPTDYFDTDLELIIIYPDMESDYYWSMPGALPTTSTESPRVSVIYPRFEAGTYEVKLTETNVYGCTDSVKKDIVVLEDEMLFAPTAFTPNGDPFNATWRVYAEGFDWTEFEIRIFDRWGELIWQGNSPEDEWNGTYLDGNLVLDDTYIWYVKGRDQITDEILEYQGFVTVLK